MVEQTMKFIPQFPKDSFSFRKSVFQGLILSALFFFSYLMFHIILPYTSGRTDIDFLLTKQHIIHLIHYRAAFYLHIFSSLYLLLSGALQFSPRFLQKYPQWHRRIGWGYVAIILCISGPSALVLSFYGNGGWLAKMSFILLSLCWIVSTWVALKTARKKRWKRHQAFMIRSYALTLSAISLRIYQFLNAYFGLLEPDIAYMLISWLSFLGNAIIGEVLIAHRGLPLLYEYEFKGLSITNRTKHLTGS